MKCPYRTNVIHKEKYTYNYVTHAAKDIMEFPECYGTECPFYNKTSNTCLKANKEANMNG